MSKPRFGIDLDGVIYNWDDTARFLLKHYHGYDLPEALHWNYYKENVKPEHWTWVWDEGVKFGLFRYGHLYKGSAEALRELSLLVDLVVITHRPAQAVQDTLEWLAYQRFPAVEVHILTQQQPKSSVERCEFYLDDGIHNLVDLLKYRPTSTVMRWIRPWNHTFDDPQCVNIRFWSEVVEVVKNAR